MAGVDLNQDYKNASDKIKSLETYKQISEGVKSLISQQQSSLEQDTTNTASPLQQLSEQKKRYQRQVTSQLEKLFDLNNLLPDNRLSGKTNSSTASLIKNEFSEALNQIKSEIPQIIADEMLKQLGCSQEQTYDTTQFAGGIYVPVQSVDIMGMLKIDPKTQIGKIKYEKEDIVIQNYPFAMNKQLYNLIQNPQVSYDDINGQNYLGQSKQNLFNITYVTKDGSGNSGDFFKVTLSPRKDDKNLISQFMVDYFNTIQLVDTKNIFLQAFEILFGAVSIELKTSSSQIEDGEYFQKILTRVMGLCFDSRSEIDVSGISKVAPLDGVDDSFFELTDIDLREIESKLSNIQRGVIEYQDCTNVKLPVNTQDLLNSLSNVLLVNDDNSAGNTAVLNKTIDTVKGNTQWPQISSIGLKIDKEMAMSLPKAMFTAVLSPKVLLPFMTMFKALETILAGSAAAAKTSAVDQVNDLKSFMKIFKAFNLEVMSKIGARFVKILRNIIVRDLRKLLQSVTKDLQKSQITKKYAIISQLIELTLLISQFIDDYRKCKNLIQDIINIIEFTLRGSRIDIPPFLTPLASLRSGFNSVRANLEVVQNLQALGIPTGPMPDGSPNLFMISIKGLIEGVESERDKNSKVQALIPPLVITPAFLTIPTPMTGLPI